MSGRGGLEIVLDHVTFRYAEMEMGFDLSFAAGSVTAIMGPSGAGKSTLLNLVAGFETPVSHLDVAANVGLGRSPALKLSWEDRAAVADALARTGLLGKEKRLPSELSGGERQRVALARVLVRNRPVLLLDEPFASLDAALRREMTGLVGELHFRTGMTILMVTHDVEDARRIADRVVRVEAGHVVGLGAAEEPAPGRRLSGQKRE
ncbi:MAG: ATP-binding cassette domain-containing protein [Rhizobiales bacterium]|nr:ATP-binding cassette domain-containing protein [Hyphomicrobiales bacterium]